MHGPCSGKNLISILVTDHIQKRRGQAFLFSFEYNLLANLISNFNHYMDRATVPQIKGLVKNTVVCSIFGISHGLLNDILQICKQ